MNSRFRNRNPLLPNRRLRVSLLRFSARTRTFWLNCGNFPCQVRPCQVRPCQVRPCQVRPCQVRPCQGRPTDYDYQQFDENSRPINQATGRLVIRLANDLVQCSNAGSGRFVPKLATTLT